MKKDKEIELLAGFYADERYHIWGSDNVFILVRNARNKTARFEFTLGKGKNVEIINCCRQEEILSVTTEKDDGFGMVAEIDLTDDSVLLNFRTSDYLQPNVDIPGSDDYRRLGICFHEMKIVSGDLEKMVDSLKVDKDQTLFNLDSFNKKFVHDVDYRFLKLFAEMEIPGYFLDIGANIGQSACSVAAVHPTIKIICYEPDKLLGPNLEIVKKILNGRMDYYLCGVGAKNETAVFYIPRYNDIYFTQEGSFLKEEADSEESKRRIMSSLHKRDIKIELEKLKFETITFENNAIETYFIKIDTQGYERDSIMGLKNVIENYQPVILIEKGFEKEEIKALLPDYGIFFYDFDNRKFTKTDTGTANVFLIPENGTKNEKINQILFRQMDV